MARDKERDPTIHDLALEAVDEDTLADVLERAAGTSCERDAAEALHQVVADGIVSIAAASAMIARRRARSPTADDVGSVADGGCCCCCDDRGAPLLMSSMSLMDPAHMWFET